MASEIVVLYDLISPFLPLIIVLAVAAILVATMNIVATVLVCVKKVPVADKLLWILIIWFGVLFGWIIYFTIGAKQLREKEAGRMSYLTFAIVGLLIGLAVVARAYFSIMLAPMDFLYDAAHYFEYYWGVFRTLFLALIPLIVLQIGLTLIAFVNIAKKAKAPSGYKTLWVLVSIITIIGPIIYFTVGAKSLEEKSIDT